MVSKELLEILACPECKSSVEEDGEWLACTGCHRRYPVREGIPVMLVEEAVLPDQEESSADNQATS